jgi:hypothetical protein
MASNIIAAHRLCCLAPYMFLPFFFLQLFSIPFGSFINPIDFPTGTNYLIGFNVLLKNIWFAFDFGKFRQCDWITFYSRQAFSINKIKKGQKGKKRKLRGAKMG